MATPLKLINLSPSDTNQSHPCQHDLLPNPRETFRLVLFSPSNSGKSNLIKNIITRAEFGYGKYYQSNIFIVSQTLKVDKIWDDLKLLAANLYDEYSEGVMNNIMHYSKTTKTGVLIVLDDIITSDAAINNKHSNFLKRLFFQGRHYRVSIILVSQKLKSVPASLRLNATHLICFDLRNRKEEKDFFEENSGIEDIERKYNVATAKRFDFLYINNITGTTYHNFETEL
jgi:hypothetical protein